MDLQLLAPFSPTGTWKNSLRFLCAGTSQIGRRNLRDRPTNERRLGRDSVGAGARMVASGSANHLQHLQLSRRRRKNNK
jgi:hypothetical protein